MGWSLASIKSLSLYHFIVLFSTSFIAKGFYPTRLWKNRPIEDSRFLTKLNMAFMDAYGLGERNRCSNK